MEKKENKVDFVKWFSELSNKDIKIAGGKGASLAEMYNNKFPIPPGFIVTAQAYRYFILHSGIDKQIEKILTHLDVNNTKELEASARKIREIISDAPMPKEMEDEIIEAYNILDVDKQSLQRAHSGALQILKNSHEPPFVAVRSSATAEDLADASFAGQQESFLNVKGHKELIQRVKDCFASLFTSRAVFYRTKKGFDHLNTQLAVVVQRMVDSEKSGVMFSRNPVKNENVVMIEAVWGLGEGIVSGRIKPDNYLVDPDEFKIIKIEVSEKKVAITRDSSGKNQIVKLKESRAKQQVLTNYEIIRLAQYAKQLEEHYGKPQDIEFAIEGGEIYIVQSRPITTLEKLKGAEKTDEIKGKVILTGLGASPGISSGAVRIIHDLSELDKVKKGDVLVTEMTNPDMVVSMARAAAIITDEGGITSHAAIVSREMGIPCVVGTGEATKILKEGELVTVDGNTGKIIEGKGETRLVEILPVVPTKTKIKVILDLPGFASRAAQTKVSGVGLARLEGIIAGCGKHPLYFMKNNKIKEYIDIIAEGLKKISEPFEEVWIRTSDIRTDEFRDLECAPQIIEGNPMLGNHGIRFGIKNKPILVGEITGIKEVADEYPNKIFGIMMPQVISVEEVRIVKEIMKAVGIGNNVKLGIMVETPAAVQIINSLCEEGIRFISFGTNDLTQYTLAVDRNNADEQELFNEMHPAVLNSIAYVIRRCKHYGVETSICGQAGSREEMVKFLIEHGIDSISVNADSAQKVSMIVAEMEKKMKNTERLAPIQPASSGGSLGAAHKIKENVRPIPVKVQQYKNKIPDKDYEMERAMHILFQDEYQPTIKDDKKDIPSIVDAVPINSEHFENKEEIKEIDLG